VLCPFRFAFYQINTSESVLGEQLEAIEGLDHLLRIMDFLIHHMFRTSALRFPEEEALVDRENRLTFEEAVRKIAGLAEGLRQAGLQRGDRVGIYLETSVLQALSIFGVSQAGGVFVPINSLLFPEQVAHIAGDCKMTGLIMSRDKVASLASALKNIHSLKFVIVTDADNSIKIAQPVHALNEFFALPVPLAWRDWSIGKDLAALLYTSGSTGKPKGVMLSHEQVIAGSSIVSDYLGITSEDRIIGVLPLSFDAGLNQLMTAVQQGGTYVPMTFVFAREIVKMLQGEKITGMAGVPTLWSLMVQPSLSLDKQSLPHLRYITNTGGRMPQTVLNALRKALDKTQVFLMYGLTEAFRSTYLPPEELDRRPTSIGKAIPNTEILVVNEHSQSCKPGEVGELVHRGPTVSMGYWGQPDLTAKVLRRHPFLPTELGAQERVCYSGDLVKMDEDGFLYFIGRRDTMIKSSGFRISPTEVEEVLFQSGQVRQAAVIGMPDEVLGQSIKAFVVSKNGDGIGTNALLGFCAEKMPRHMVPKAVEVLDELPKTTSGKVDYPALRRREGL
jgi:acyl-CoA ligase (AMP-forming) (exosortase A-associated)